MNTNDVKTPIRTEMRGRTLWIWIDREQRRNAINKDVISEIANAVHAAQDDASLRRASCSPARVAMHFAPAPISLGERSTFHAWAR